MPLYPPITPSKTGFLEVSQNPPHKIFWQEYGNPDGVPVMYIHGGPGGGCRAEEARFFDASHYRIIQFDQRGAGQSLPMASLDANTTQDSISDITKLREHLNIKGKMHLFGGSWGSTLSLAYAIHYPETVASMVLRGIFLCRKKDLDIFYQGDAADRGNPALMGSGHFFPDAWDQYVNFIPEDERGDMIAAYRERLKDGADKTIQMEAAKRWSIWEGSTSKLIPDKKAGDIFGEEDFALRFARIENWYFLNAIFLGEGYARDQNFIIDKVAKICHIPTKIVHGRYDLVCPRNQADDLCAAWNAVQPDAALQVTPVIIDDAGHSASEKGISDELCRMADSMRALDV